MTYDFCLSCGVLLSPNVYECPVCGFNHNFNDLDPGEDDLMLNEGDDLFDFDEEY